VHNVTEPITGAHDASRSVNHSDLLHQSCLEDEQIKQELGRDHTVVDDDHVVPSGELKGRIDEIHKQPVKNDGVIYDEQLIENNMQCYMQ